MVHACSMPTRVAVRLERSDAEETPSPHISLCPAIVCRQREVKRAVLSRAANLWPYLPVKSIEVSESRAECAGGELEGLPLACCPPGPSWGVPACLFTLHLFCFGAPVLRLLSQTHSRMGATIPTYVLIQVSHDIRGADVRYEVQRGGLHSVTRCARRCRLVESAQERAQQMDTKTMAHTHKMCTPPVP